MQTFNTYTGRLAAAVTAIALSLVLITGTVSAPAQARTADAVFVGVVA